jgi:predicted transcriptional regulator
MAIHPLLAKVKAELEEHRGEWPAIAKETGVGYSTIQSLAQGRIDNPRLKTVQTLLDYFEKQAAA